LGELKWTPEEFEAFVAGIRARYKGQVVPIDEKSAAIIEVQQKRIAELKRGRGSKDVSAGLEELRRSLKMDARPSGLAYQMLAGGSGPRPRPQDTIVFSMTARECEEGREIASMHREKVRSRVSDLMPGLAEGAQILTLGGSALFLLPGDLSFGTGEWPADVKRGVPIIVVVQLLEIVPSEN
jgi:FKBP-type peptidyl-prolyl cis-trans isomerase